MANLPQIDMSVWCQWEEEDQNRRWGINVDLVESIPAEIVLQRIKANVVPKEETITLIKEKLQWDLNRSLNSIGQTRDRQPVSARHSRAQFGVVSPLFH